MTPEQKDRVREVFLAACEQDPQQRAEFVRRASGGDDVVRKEVESLLAHDDEAGTFLQTPALGRTFADARPDALLAEGSSQATRDSGVNLDAEGPPSGTCPEYIGQYKILGILGKGGMGVVYRAEQASPHRTVALKVIRPGAESSETLKRFEHEGQVLGWLQHPGIAQVFEAGTADTGQGPRPFFAMELVQGRPLTEYAHEHQLSIRRRLELIAKVCDAVQHAHQKGVIHRDLKPGNILVDASGQPKILDFGVARATDADIRTTTLQTDIGQLIGTIAYMSPEQVAGDSSQLDTRSDVFALGVISYELLTGRVPLDVSRKTLPRAARMIAEEEPSSLRLMNKAFRGDIETIVAKALEKDKNNRYQSASDLAADIRRHLSDQPISAHPATTFYQLRKFARRNKSLVTVVVIALVALVGGLINVTWARDRAVRAERLAEQRRDEAEAGRAEAQRQTAIAQAVNDFLNDDLLAAANPEEMGRDVTVREVLDKASAGIKGRFVDEPLVEAAIRMTLGDTYASLGAYESAVPHAQRALELRRAELGEDHPRTLSALGMVGYLHGRQGHYDEEEPLAIETLARRRRVLGEEHPDTLSSMNSLAVLRQMQGRLKEAEALFAETLVLRRSALGPEHPETLNSMTNLAGLYSRLGRYDASEQLLTETLGISVRVLGEESHRTLGVMHTLALLYRRQGRFDEAEALFLKTLNARRRVLGDDHPRTLLSMDGLAGLYRRQGRFDEAEPLCARSVEVKRRDLGAEHPSTLSSLNTLASVYSRQGRHDEAEILFSETLQARRKVLGENHPHTLTSLNNLAVQYCRRGRFEEAEPLLLKALEVQHRLFGEDHPKCLVTMHNLAGLCKDLGRLDDSEAWYRDTVEARRRVLGDGHPDTLVSMNNLAILYQEQGRRGEAERLHRKVLAGRRRALGDSHRDTLESMRGLVLSLIALDKFEDAETLAIECYDRHKSVYGPDDDATRNAIDLLVDLYDGWGKPAEAAQWRTTRGDANNADTDPQ